MKTFIWIVLLEIPTCEPATWQRAARSSTDSPFGGEHLRPCCQGQHICYQGIILIFLLDHPVIKYHDPHLCRRRTSGFDGDRVREVALRSARVEAVVTSSVFWVNEIFESVEDSPTLKWLVSISTALTVPGKRNMGKWHLVVGDFDVDITDCQHDYN